MPAAQAAEPAASPFTAADYALRGEKLIEGFAGLFLSPRYDQAKPTPPFHREVWNLYASQAKQCAVAAPRNHAKSTGLTHDYILTEVLFRYQSYVMLLGASEEMAIGHLGDIANELRDNEDIIQHFGIKKLITDAKTEVICLMKDGHSFRIVARGGEQMIRGVKWHGSRPGLIVVDDVESDESVESKERRLKFRRWFFRAAKQALRDGGKIRVHGTIMHEDSLLARLMKNKQWTTKRYAAHESFDDFSNILWPEKFSEERLRAIRQEFIDEGDSAGYSQEYLNDPFDNDEAYFKAQDFLEMSEDDYETAKVCIASADFGVSKESRADPSALGVGGKDANNILHMLDVRKDRWDALGIIDEMFSLVVRWRPEVFFIEGGAIATALLPMIYREMQVRDIWFNISKVPPMKDKATRARSIQRRMRAGGVRFDKRADWYAGLEAEMRRFTGYAKAARDDQVDMMALMSFGFDNLAEVEVEDFMEDDEAREYNHRRRGRPNQNAGRSPVTGY